MSAASLRNSAGFTSKAYTLLRAGCHFNCQRISGNGTPASLQVDSNLRRMEGSFKLQACTISSAFSEC